MIEQVDSRSDMHQSCERTMGTALTIGILIAPFIFAWLTLRRGYSAATRAQSIGYAVASLLMYGGMLAMIDRIDDDQLIETSSYALFRSETTAAPEAR